MKRKFAFLMILLVFGSQLFAFGKKEEEPAKTHNDKWILCVTDFDTNSVPEEKLVVAGVITKKIVERMSVISYRVRIYPEYAFYESQVWTEQRSSAAKALSAKQNERSQLVYRGDVNWRYKRNLAKLDAEIEKLWITLEETGNNAPLISKEPEFELTPGNLNFTFPQAPKARTENKFCADQKADAFLAGEIIDYHGRFFVSIKLYTLYTRSFVYEDSIIFSPDDLEEALDEITQKLVLVLSGGIPSAITVKTQPEEALVLINRSFAGRGETGIIEYPPGKITITASAPDYESMTVETELSPGELAEIEISLLPNEYGSVEIADPLLSGKVYYGALYVGEPPLTLSLPLNVMEYVELETSDKKKGTAVFFTPDDIDTAYLLSIKPVVPPKKGSVGKVRRQYYWAWGTTWVTGIAAWITYRTFIDADAAFRYNAMATNEINQKFNEKNTKMYYASMGTAIAVGVAVAYEIFQMSRYVYTANKGATKLEKTDRIEE